MSTTARKPLNLREARALARQLGGPRCTAIIAPSAAGPTKQVLELATVAGAEVRGAHPTSWRRALHNAGLFWEQQDLR